MGDIVSRWSGGGVTSFEAALKTIADDKVKLIYVRALNRTAERVFTVVKRTVAAQVGLPQKVVVARGAMRIRKATGGILQASVDASGGFMPLRLFAARKTKAGVTAAPWGTRRVFKHTFLVGKAGGNVFKRLGKGRLPIKKLWGPAVPREMVRDESAAAFHAVVGAEMPKRLAHEISRATGGVIS